MLVLSGSLVNKQVLSLRTSTPVATVKSCIINPNNLKIEGFYCQDFRKEILILVSQDIREVSATGYIVNDHDVLVKDNDLVRLHKVLEVNFNPIGKSVETESKQKIGKVSDYSTDLDSMIIQKLYVSQPIYKSFVGGSLIIDRNQIVEINPRKIIVNDLLAGAAVEFNATA